MSFQTAFSTLILNPLITRESQRVFAVMYEYVDFENVVTISQKDIGTRLGINSDRVSKAVRNLVEQGILLKGKKDRNAFTYHLSPLMGWKGKVKNYHKFNEEQAQEKTYAH